MKFTKQQLAVVSVGLLMAFAYGMIAAHYRVFPFEQLRALKQLVRPSREPDAQQPSAQYIYKKSFFEEHGQRADIVMIGDSLTDAAEWHELFPGRKIANRGIYGDSTAGVLERLDSILATKAGKAFIMLGINDIVAGVDVETIAENYRSIVEQLAGHGMRPYIQSTLLAAENYEQHNASVLELNRLLKKIADENDAVTYIDLNGDLAQDALLNARYTVDGVHLNGLGYTIWLDRIKEYIE
jgi:lysophospholipase L1-like esterase